MPADALNSAVVGGTWDTWKLIPGGTAGLLKMQCPITRGTGVLFSIVANTHTTLDPATIGNLVLSSDRLSVSNVVPLPIQSAPFFNSAIGTQGQRSGKLYFECTLGSSTDEAMIGVAPANAPKQRFADDPSAYAYGTDGFVMSAGQAAAFDPAGGTTDPSTPGSTAGEKWDKPGDIVGVALDLDDGKILVSRT